VNLSQTESCEGRVTFDPNPSANFVSVEREEYRLCSFA
jgi:hypothetical protein